jgi:UDP-glucose 4-epimerase
MESYQSSSAFSSCSSLHLSSAPTSRESSLINEPVSRVDSQQDLLSIDNGGKVVLVVGGLGYIGSHTTLELLKAGYNVVVVDDLSNSFEIAVQKISKLALQYFHSTGHSVPFLKFHQCDYRSAEMRAVIERYSTPGTPSSSSSGTSGEAESSYESRISGVIHFAAFKAVEESIQKPLAYYQNNVCGLVDFLVLLREFNITNFVFSSSATVYGAKTNEGQALKESDLVHFPETLVNDKGLEVHLVPGAQGLSSPYGRTKYFSEAILADVANADPSWKITALRYFNPVGCHESGLLGEDPRQKPTNLFPVIAQVLTGQKTELDIFGSDWSTVDGTAVRDFIHVVDLARGHVAALSVASSGTIHEAFRSYNLGTGLGSSVAEVVSSFEDTLGCKIPAVRGGRRAGDVGFCIAATERVERELKWKTEKSLDECARDTWNYICKTKQAAVAK